MKIRPLLIDDEVKARVQVVRAFAEKEENIYRPGGTPPGNIPEHVLKINTYRCVFSITEATHGSGEKQLFQHFSVSVPEKDKLPNPVVVWTLASLFGLTGWGGSLDPEQAPPTGWLVSISPNERCIIVAQPYHEA